MLLFLLLALLAIPVSAKPVPPKAIVRVPVADLRSDRTRPPAGQSDDKQQTQLLSGEIVEILKTQGDWVYVSAIEQPEYSTHQKWEGYPGWVLKSAVTTALPPKPKSTDAKDPLLFAETLIGTTYYWGGLSAKGIDCSGLTHLAYRMSHQVIPRDSHEQWMRARPIRPKELQPGDLIFSAKADNPLKVSHVTMYAGDGMIVEAPQTGMVVRKISFVEKYGKRLWRMHYGIVVNDRVIYFGTYRK